MSEKKMSRDEMLVALGGLDPERVARVYSGRPGCGCGCKGKYWSDARNIKRVVRLMKENAPHAERLDFDEKDGVAAVEGDRFYWAYLKGCRWIKEDEADENPPTIQIEDTKITDRWKTVEDSKADGFGRMTTMFEAGESKERVLAEMDEDERKQVKFRIKQSLGFYFIQARLS